MKLCVELKAVVTAVAIGFAAVVARADKLTPEEMAAYARTANCTVAGYEGDGVNEAVRLLVRVSPKAILGFDYADVLSEGRDVRFVTSDGTLLPYELDTWNTAGESAFWVLVPKLEQGMSFKMLYGKANDAGPAAADIWDGYAGVWHMNEDANHAMADSSANGLEASVVQPERASQTAGIVGRAFCHPQQDASGQAAYVNIPTSETLDGLSGSLAFSVWLRTDAACSGRAVVWNNCGGNYGSGAIKGSDVSQPDNEYYLSVCDNGARSTAGLGYSLRGTQWHQLVIAYDGTTRHVYFDGKYLSAFEGATTYVPRSGYPWLLGTRTAGANGAYQFVGGLDEFRIRTSCPSAAAVNAEYQMMMKGTSFLCCEVEDDPAVLTTFAKRIDVTVTGFTGAETLTNFPFAVRLSPETVPNWSPAEDMRADGRDICFTDGDGTPLAFEVDTWNPSGESVYWVKVPELTNGTVVCCHFGRADAAFEGTGVGTVWYGYAGVWHVNEPTDGKASIANASGTGVPATGGSVSVVTDGVFGKARGNSLGCNTNAVGSFSTVACQALDLGSNFTLSGWFYGYDCNGSQYIASRAKGDGSAAWTLGCYTRASVMRDITFAPTVKNKNSKTFASSTYVSPNVWHKFDLVVDGRTVSFYLDGESYSDPLTYSVDVSQADSNEGPQGIAFGGTSGGKAYYTANMVFDEVRYSAGVRSADWIRAEYRASRLAPKATPLATYSRARPNDSEAFRKTFRRSVDLTVTGLAEGVALTNFPLSVKLSSETVSHFNSAEMRADGRDICFLSADGAPLAFEVDTWNPSGESVYWVKVPELKNGIRFNCLYGRAQPAIATEKDSEVWRDYVSVWHVNEASDGEVALADASPNEIGMTGGGISTVYASGVFGKARGSSSRGSASVSCGLTEKDSRLDLGSSFTISCWAYFADRWGPAFVFSLSDRANGNGWKFYSTDKNNRFGFTAGSESTYGTQEFPTEGGEAGEGVWRKIDLVCDGLQQTLYMDGELVGTVTSACEPAMGDYGLAIGGSSCGSFYTLSCGAYFDEIRYSAGQRRAEWIRAEYRASGQSATPLVTYSRAKRTRKTGVVLYVK